MKRDNFQTILKEVGRALVALAPYRNELILVGGIVPVLYRRKAELRQPEHPAIATTEADIALPPRLPVVEGKTISDLLFAAGFVIYEAPGLNRKGPAKQFFQDAAHGTDRGASTYLEFLTPLLGKPREGLVEPHPGIRAPALRYLDLLSHEPWTMDARDVAELDVVEPCPVRIPHPTMYVLQKVLARSSGRSPSKQPKDMAYAYDVAVLTQPVWNDLSVIVSRATEKNAEWSKWIARALRDLDALFATETSDGTIEAARVYRNAMRSGAPTEKAVAAVVKRFAEAMRR